MIIAGIGNITLLLIDDENRKQYFNLINENLEAVVLILAVLTPIGTIIIAMLMYQQNRQQKKEHDLKLRPVLISNERVPGTPCRITYDHVILTIMNVGSVPASNIRIMMLPLDRYNEFRIRRKALMDYLKEIRSDDVRSTKSCIVMDPPNERIKHAHDPLSSVKYLIFGNDFKNINPKIEKFNKMMDRIQDKNIREKFETANRDRIKSLAPLQHANWDQFYMVGLKSGDLLDKIGPIDLEIFYGGDWDRTRKILADYASTKSPDVKKYIDEVCNTKKHRDRIIDNMTEDMKKDYHNATSKLLEIWNKLPDDVVKEYVENNMELRKAYKETNDVKSILISVLGSNDFIELRVERDPESSKHISGGEYVHFGVLIQYSQLEDKDMRYAYYIQGYVGQTSGYVDYTDVIHI